MATPKALRLRRIGDQVRGTAFLLGACFSSMNVQAGNAQAPDSLPLGWRRADTLFASSYELTIDRQAKRTGRSSLRIHSSTGATLDYEDVTQTFLADDFRGRRVRFGAYFRLGDSTGAVGLLMLVAGSRDGVPFDNTLIFRPLRGPTEWQRQEIVLDVPQDAGSIRIGVLFRGPGTVWIDDLDFSPVDRTIPTTGRILPGGGRPRWNGLERGPRSLGFEPTQIVAVPAAPFTRRNMMIPMRDGVRLFTVIVAPRVAPEPLPILLQRTPYGEGPQLRPGLVEDGYIFVIQDIRGRYRSEGSFVMNRPARDPRDSAAVDETTDAYDTVEWLVHNVSNTNGRVGVIGSSYDGWLAEVVLLGPHPAVKAVSPQGPMTDTWMGDDFFHQGAFRQEYALAYAVSMEGQNAAGAFPTQADDLYAWYGAFPTVESLAESTGAVRTATGRRFVEHPAYDSVWRGRAFQGLVTGLAVPTLSVGGWWDAEDLFGPQATYRALERFDTAGVNALVIGPWFHTEWEGTGGSRLGNLRFGSATADTFHLRMEAPWFAYWLKGRGNGHLPKVWLFDAGANRWRTFDRWPPRGVTTRRLYFHAGTMLSFAPPIARVGFDEYVSDPARPVPYVAAPVHYDVWSRWMTQDQRFASARGDVLTWQTEPLNADVAIAGDVTARLFASTTGSDADWVVKLIDVYPDSVADRPEMGGYQLMVAGDILRGRYRRSFERATPIPVDEVESFTVDLHQQCYTFRRGHRIMVQVQSSWFPLYDRNPQIFVPNIFRAPAAAYRAQTHRIYHTASQPSGVDVMVLDPSRTTARH